MKLLMANAKGTVSISNLGSKTTECINLSYTLNSQLKSLSNITKIIDEMDALHDIESDTTVTIKHFDTDETEFVVKYKIMSCGSEAKARTIKNLLDQYVQKLGGQTVLGDLE